MEAETADDTRRSFMRGERVCIPPPTDHRRWHAQSIAGRVDVSNSSATRFGCLSCTGRRNHRSDAFPAFAVKAAQLSPQEPALLRLCLTGKLPPDLKRVGVVLSGGNVDAAVIANLLTRERDTLENRVV
ncbi:MAG: hypothetical protein WKF84_25130 [Pyrinomonadaceae bacterium]